MGASPEIPKVCRCTTHGCFFQHQAAKAYPAGESVWKFQWVSRIGIDFLLPLNPWRTVDFPAIPDDDVGIRSRHAALGELRQTPSLGGSRGLSLFTLAPTAIIA